MVGKWHCLSLSLSLSLYHSLTRTALSTKISLRKMPRRGRGGGRGRGRGQNNRRSRPQTSTSDCKLPHRIVFNILSRLPIKSLLRFRCVCKQWRTLIRNPKFISSQSNRTARNPSLLVECFHLTSLENILTVFPLKSIENPVNLKHPYPYLHRDMDIVGLINGVVCICRPPQGDTIKIWNPATRLNLSVKVSNTKRDWTVIHRVSMGFGFDSVSKDYKLISILCFRPEHKIRAKVEVYSVNNATWKKINVLHQYTFLETSCAVVVKGRPYWSAMVDNEFGTWETYVSFDLQKEVFERTLSVPEVAGRRNAQCCLLDLNDSLAAVVYHATEELGLKTVDVWMMEADAHGYESWSKKFTVGPIGAMKKLLGCAKNEEIVAEDGQGKLFLYDNESRGVRYLPIDGACPNSYQVFNYEESLAVIKGATEIEEFSTEAIVLDFMGFPSA